jgi:FMN phosphatase YigB (HAD superfamily)
LTSKPRIRTIFSDLGKVVFDFDNMRMAEALAVHSSAFNASQVHDLMLRELREAFDAYMRGHLTTVGYRRVAKRALQLTCTDAAFDKAFTDVFTPNAPIVREWEALRGDGVRLVATSNIEELRHAKLLEMGLEAMFDVHCLSYRIGVSKPDPEFFRRALAMADCDPGETLCVDDHAEMVDAARSLGIHGIVYDLNDHAAFDRAFEGYAFARYVRR